MINIKLKEFQEDAVDFCLAKQPITILNLRL